VEDMMNPSGKKREREKKKKGKLVLKLVGAA